MKVQGSKVSETKNKNCQLTMNWKKVWKELVRFLLLVKSGLRFEPKQHLLVAQLNRIALGKGVRAYGYKGISLKGYEGIRV